MISTSSARLMPSSVIGSMAAADKNRLDTGTLGFGNIENRAEYEVEHQSVGISSGGNIGGQFVGSGENIPSLAAQPASQPAHYPAETSVIACETTSSGELLMRCGPRVWRVRGWQKNTVSEVMKVNVQVRDESTGAFHVDSLDMYHAKQRQNYASAAAVELGCEPS